MAKVLTDGKISIGAYMFPDRKKPALCIGRGAEIQVYGTFNSKEGTNEFMNSLGKFVGAVFEKESDKE